jgi:hypothetical protein
MLMRVSNTSRRGLAIIERNARRATPIRGKLPETIAKEALATVPPTVAWVAVVNDLTEFFPIKPLSVLIGRHENLLSTFVESKYKNPKVDIAFKLKAMHKALFSAERHAELFEGWDSLC